MDVKELVTIISGSVTVILLTIGIILYRRDQAIKNNSTEKTKGMVVKYALHLSRGPRG